MASSSQCISSIGTTIGGRSVGGQLESRGGLDDPAEEGRDGVDPAGDAVQRYGGVVGIAAASYGHKFQILVLGLVNFGFEN